MLGMFSVMMLTELPRDSQDSYIGPLEWIVCVLMFSWIIHEAVQIGSKSDRKEYFRNDWNKVDMAGCVLFVMSFSLRLGGQLDHARGCYSVAILLLYMRFLQVFVVFKTIGLYVFMVRLAVRMNAQQNVHSNCLCVTHDKGSITSTFNFFPI